MRLTTLLIVGISTLLLACQPHPRSDNRKYRTSTAMQIRFYETFCSELAKELSRLDDSCDDYIFRPAPQAEVEPPRSMAPVDRVPASKPTLVFVPGIFGQCVSPWVTPFSDAYSSLQSEGYKVLVIPVDGRSSSEQNATEIDRFLEAHFVQGERLIVFGYSKGATDFLTALSYAQSAAWVSNVDAFVSVAGVIHGTPLADTYASLYERWISKVPFPTCQPGIGNAVGSMSVSYRESWLASHPVPSDIRYFSVSAVANGRRMNPMLLPFWTVLASEGSESDGQVTPDATRLPGGTALATLKGDHWAIVLPFESSDSVLVTPFKIGNHYPRSALIWAILKTIAPN